MRNTYPPEVVAIRDRLRIGQQALIRAFATDKDIVDDLIKWDGLEKQLRDKGFSECVIGPSGCDPNAISICDTCVAKKLALRRGFAGPSDITGQPAAAQSTLFQMTGDVR